MFGADATRKALEAVLCLALSIPVGLLAGCSSGGSDDEPTPPTPELASVRVSESSGIMPCGGTLEAEYADAPAGCGIDKIVDRNSNTKFITGHSKFYLLWTGDESAEANCYSLTSADDAPEADPKAWTLYGSDDNVSWTALDSCTGQIFAKRKEKKEFEFESDRAYKYLKLEIEDNGGAAVTQIAELSIKHVVINIDDLMHLSTSHTYDSTNPMGCNFTHLRAATAEDLKKLADPSIDPAPFDDFKYYDFSRRVVLYPSTGGRPSPADVNQHAVGDCCAVAVFASFAYLHPDFIKSIITDNHDGTYTVAMFDPIPGSVTGSSFSHIFAGGYAAGYYSYKWAEVLDADAFAHFKEHGIFDSETADSFRRNILMKGGTEQPDELYRRFRGHDASIDALLKRDGISVRSTELPMPKDK